MEIIGAGSDHCTGQAEIEMLYESIGTEETCINRVTNANSIAAPVFYIDIMVMLRCFRVFFS